MVLTSRVGSRTPAVKEFNSERSELKFKNNPGKQEVIIRLLFTCTYHTIFTWQDMQRYMTHLLRQEPHATADTMAKYIRNYNEKPQDAEEKLSDHVSQKNFENFPINKSTNLTVSSGPKLPVQFIQFELSDAAVPNKETEESIRKGRARIESTQMLSHKLPIKTKSEKLQNANRPVRPQSRRSTTRNKPDADMATQESRMIQILHPSPNQMMTQYETSESRQVKSLHEFPSEVRGVLNLVISRDTQKNFSGKLYKDKFNEAQRYGLRKEPHGNNHLMHWWKPVKNNRLILRPVSSYNKKDYKFHHSNSGKEFSQPDPNHFNPPESTNSYHERPKTLPFKIAIPDEPVKGEIKYPIYALPYALVDHRINQQPNQIDDLTLLHGRPQDSTAPVLFPFGARQPLPKSNTTIAILQKFHQKPSVATPVINTDFYYPQKNYNSIGPSLNSIPGYYATPHLIQPTVAQPVVPHYYPKDHTPITEPPAEGESHHHTLPDDIPSQSPLFKHLDSGDLAPTSYNHYHSGPDMAQNVSKFNFKFQLPSITNISFKTKNTKYIFEPGSRNKP